MGILQLSEGMERPVPTLADGQISLKGLETWLASPAERLQWQQKAEFSGFVNLGENR